MLKEAFDQLLPPDLPPVQRWRIIIFAAMMIFSTHIMWACGWLAAMGLGSGFAKAAEVGEKIRQADSKFSQINERLNQRSKEVTLEFEEVRQGQKEIKISMIEQAVLEVKEGECTSTNRMAKNFFSSKIQEMSREYFDMARVPLQIPPCKNAS